MCFSRDSDISLCASCVKKSVLLLFPKYTKWFSLKTLILAITIPDYSLFFNNCEHVINFLIKEICTCIKFPIEFFLCNYGERERERDSRVMSYICRSIELQRRAAPTFSLYNKYSRSEQCSKIRRRFYYFA